MAKGSKITGATKALPGGTKAGASFTKRSGATTKQVAGKGGKMEDYGPRTAENAGAVVTDDRAGTKSRADLPPETRAMKAPEAMVPDAVKSLASPVLPVPGCHDKLFTVEPFDYARDRKLGKQGN